MVVVFGAFMATDLVLLKMIGFGLTVTVLVDATLIRTLMVPAAMCLAGRWNWGPGAKGSNTYAERSAMASSTDARHSPSDSGSTRLNAFRYCDTGS